MLFSGNISYMYKCHQYGLELNDLFLHTAAELVFDAADKLVIEE
jgi:hypothetical protein